MSKLARNLAIAIGSLLLAVLYNILTFGATAAAISAWKQWAFLPYFAWLFLGTVVGLTGTKLLLMFPRLRRALTLDPARFERPFWKWVKQRGVFPLAALSTMFATPIVAAMLLRTFPLRERRIWFIALSADIAVTLVIVSLCLGLSHIFLHG